MPSQNTNELFRIPRRVSYGDCIGTSALVVCCAHEATPTCAPTQGRKAGFSHCCRSGKSDCRTSRHLTLGCRLFDCGAWPCENIVDRIASTFQITNAGQMPCYVLVGSRILISANPAFHPRACVSNKWRIVAVTGNRRNKREQTVAPAMGVLAEHLDLLERLDRWGRVGVFNDDDLPIVAQRL